MDRVATFRSLAELWNSSEIDAFLEAAGPDLVFTPDPRWPEQGSYSGGEFRAFLVQWYETWGGESHLAVDDVQEVGEAVLAHCRWIVSGASSGAQVAEAFWLVAWFSDSGSVGRLLGFFDGADALAAAKAGPEAAGA